MKTLLKLGNLPQAELLKKRTEVFFTVKRWEYGDIMKTANYIHIKKAALSVRR